MKQISIHRKGVLTNLAQFDTEEKAMEWLNSCLAKKKFGEPERFKEESELQPGELSTALSVEEREIDGKKKLFYKLPAQFQVTIEDVVEPPEEKAKKEYPSHQEYVEALIADKEGDDKLLKDVLKKRKDARKKHGLE